MISSFTGDYRWLSNFWPCDVEYEGVRYRTVENAYQAAKTLNLEDRKLISTQPPGRAKKLGRTVELRDDWDEIKIDVMRQLLTQKFQNVALRHKLEETGNQTLVEGNSWHDNFWGVCECAACDSAKHRASNWLGKLLMEVRMKLSTGDQPDEPMEGWAKG